MPPIPDKSQETARGELSADFLGRIDIDFRAPKCVWCKAGASKNKKNNHSLKDCPTAYPLAGNRTPLSNEIFNADSQDAAVAYIHHRQFNEYPRATDNATTFSAGLPRAQMATYIVPVSTTSAPPLPLHPSPLALSGPSHNLTALVPHPQPPASSATQNVPPSVPSTPTDQVSSGFASSSIVPTAGSTPVPTAPSTHVDSALDQEAPSTTLQADAVAEVKHDTAVLQMSLPKSAPAAADLKREPRKLDLGTNMNNLLNTLKNSKIDLQYPVRESFGPKPRRAITNHFEMRVDPNYTLHQYKILPAMAGKSKRRIRLAIETAIEQCAFLSTNKADFATDYFDTIVAWTRLHDHLKTSDHQLLSGNGNEAHSTWHLITLQDGPATISFQLRYEGTVDVQSLNRHTMLDPKEANTDLQPVLRALNILISKSFDGNPAALQMGANKFMLKTSHLPLSNGSENNREESNSLCTLRGYSYTVKPGAGSILLNINSVTSAFWNPVKVSEVIEDDFTFSGDYEGALRGVRVYILYDRGDPNDTETFARLNSDHARVKPIEGFGHAISLQTFEKEDGTTEIVRDYFQNTYGKTISFPEHPAVNLGTRKEPRWYPAEYLRILPYQKWKGLVPDSVTGGMLEAACQKPSEAMALVGLECIAAMSMNVEAEAKLPGCPAMTLNPTLLSVPSNVLGFPQLRYANNVPFQSKELWDIRDKPLLVRLHKTFNVIAISLGSLKDTVEQIFKTLKQYAGPEEAGFKNYNVGTLASLNWHSYKNASYDEMKKTLTGLQATAKNANLALLVLPKKNPAAYALFKIIADRELGIHSLCVTARCIQQPVGNKVSNIILKLNLKAAGVNHSTYKATIASIMTDTLVLGADVTHPGNGAIPGSPSIAAIVGSAGATGGRFLGSMRLQSQARKEIIDHVRPMVKERIIDWVKESNLKGGSMVLPENIIYYRDGVSDAQFLEVKNDELPQIERAFSDAIDELEKEGLIKIPSKRPTVKISALVCIKRHSVRFYPEKGMADAHNNCKPGTHVQSVVTSPYFNDFYLQSHAAIKGTAISAHYFVLRKDQDISIDDLRKLTHELCYTYVRAPCGISYASPAYYADRMCERGRHYLRDIYQRTPEGEQLRNAFDRVKWRLEDKREQDRIRKYGAFRNQDHTARRKGEAEIRQEKIHREEVMTACDEWTIGKAREIFYGNEKAEGKNPWHARIGKTMFWM